MLPKFHKKMGYDVEIIGSLLSFDENGKRSYLEHGTSYINEYGIPVTRLEYKNLILSKGLGLFEGTYGAVSKSNPDIIFIHNCQFLDIKHVVKYAKLKPNLKIYVDNHADFSNSATNFISKNMLHKIIWKYCAHQIEPFTGKFYGVLPARADFLEDVYNIPRDKVEVLFLGADDEKIEEAKEKKLKEKIRKKHNIKPDDILIITGGKIDNAKKQTLLLMEAVKKIENDKVRLIVFGSVINELKEEVCKLSDGEKIQYIGWIDSKDSYKYFAASDLAVFPGRHSVFWEQVVGLGIPMVVKHWEGTTHVDLGGNCKFLYKDSIDEIYDILINLINNGDELAKMRKVAESKGMKHFSYKEISARAIEAEK